MSDGDIEISDVRSGEVGSQGKIAYKNKTK